MMRSWVKSYILYIVAVISIVSCKTEQCDLCVYGGTASGIVAANAAAKMGLSVVVVEPTCRIGGMTTGGLGQTDIGNKAVVQGLALQFYRKLGAHYGNLENWIFEPGVALGIMEEYAAEGDIKVYRNYRFSSAGRRGTNIKYVLSRDGFRVLKVNAKCFIDASYEGDLMAGAGVSYCVGREDNSEYGEDWNGSQLMDGHQFPDGVDPFVVPGNPSSGLLWGISDQRLKIDGTGDGLVQAYNFRICLTDNPENRIPIKKPENYDPSRYELLLRVYDAQPDVRDINKYFIWSLMPNHKTDVNNRGAFSTDMIGMNYNYPEAGWQERDRIVKAHKDYTLGLLYFVANDPRVPAEIQSYVREWGLPKDEYLETGHWSPQLYIRESRRLVGEYVATQADCENKRIATDGIARAAYTMDSHNTERIVVEKEGQMMVKNEGNVEIKGGLPYPISYRSITPKREECTNLLVPVCCSASHIAYGSIRMEPVFMCLGQAAGIAAALTIGEGLPGVQDVDYTKIVDIFDNDPYMDGSTPDLILDDKDALVCGDWEMVVSTRGWGPTSHKGRGGRGDVIFSGVCKDAGDYDVYNYTHFPKNGQKPLWHGLNPQTKFTLPDGEVVTLDASRIDFSSLGQTTGAWQKIGSVHLGADEKVCVSVSGVDGRIDAVVADAIMFVKCKSYNGE